MAATKPTNNELRASIRTPSHRPAAFTIEKTWLCTSWCLQLLRNSMNFSFTPSALCDHFSLEMIKSWYLSEFA